MVEIAWVGSLKDFEREFNIKGDRLPEFKHWKLNGGGNDRY